MISVQSRKSEIIIAFIGLFGVLGTAVFSNWDKIYPEENVIREVYSGYRATGNFETEIRYFFEVSGTRATMENMKLQLADNFKMSLIKKNPENIEEIEEMLKALLEESISFDEVMATMLPVYRKHFTIEEMQELNKFYSTEIMQNMVEKMPLITQELAPLHIKLMEDFQRRLMVRLMGIGED